jgi:UDP-N-acetylglucosamine:LPS N-acetylglucosamine transferase
MPFPEFAQDKKKVLFFCRGRGRGHAIPDMEIIRALHSVRPDVEVRLVSYGAGAATLAEFGFPLVDAGLPDTSPIAEMSVIAGKLIGWLDPDLVVAHEEFAAMPAAKIFDKPALFITDWFSDAELYSMGALKFADEILFTGRPGIFSEPSWVREKIRYIGPVVRRFPYGRADRPRARADLGISENAFVVAVLPGSWRETETPLLDLVIAAYDALDRGSKRLVWLAGEDKALAESRLTGREALVFDRYWRIDRLMIAADVAITKMNRMTVFELHHLGVPTLALSWDLNPIDDQAVRGLDGVVCRAAAGLTPEKLADAIQEVAAQNPLRAAQMVADDNAEKCANFISAALK